MYIDTKQSQLTISYYEHIQNYTQMECTGSHGLLFPIDLKVIKLRLFSRLEFEIRRRSILGVY